MHRSITYVFSAFNFLEFLEFFDFSETRLPGFFIQVVAVTVRPSAVGRENRRFFAEF